jgi:SAM-dependent methyltransferase
MIESFRVRAGDHVREASLASSADLRAAWEFHRERLLDLLELARAHAPGRRVLELGAAPYLFTAMLLEAGFEVTAGGLPFGDTTEGTVEIRAAGESWSVPLWLFDAEERFPFDSEAFDVVVAGELFEHLYRQPWMLLAESWRCLRSSGRLVLSTPNGHALEHGYQWLRQGPTGQGFNPSAPSIRHAREYSVLEMREIATVLGFQVEELRTASYSHIVDGFPGRLGPLKRRIYGALKRRAMATSGPLANRGDTIFLVARKAPGDSDLEPPEFMRYGIGDERVGHTLGGESS